MASATLRVAAVQLAVAADRASNLKRAAELIGRAAAEGAKFVALPECFVGKYGVDHFAGHAEDVPWVPTDESTGAGVLAAAAARHGVTTTGGVIERDRGKLWNAFPALAPRGRRADRSDVPAPRRVPRSGEVFANYRKVHLSRVLGITSEADALAAGADPTAYDVEGFRVGMACCFDLRFPE